MAPMSLKIILDDGAVTRTLMFDTTTTVEAAYGIVQQKILTLDPDKEYGFFLTSADDECSGIWLESYRRFDYYMLRDGDSLHYRARKRNLRLRMLDGSVKTLQVDESKNIGELMVHICDRIGITNNEEYGLCREECESTEEAKPSTGTLTLKRKTVQRERDAKMEQLSKKLKTDDNVEWLDQHKTLRECLVDTNETLLFKRRLFYSDRNVDSRDPVQLNLLYVQTKDAILDGRQVVTEDKAVEFAGIQCQIQYGDYQEDKHKPGFIENLKDFLPEQYASSRSIEKKIIKEHRKHIGLGHIDAKYIYTKTARELPTYGVTFFLVKEQQKGKKKLVPRLLGINSESILRLDENTKEILQVWLLTQVQKFKAAEESFTLNFGDYSDKEYSVKTNEAFRIKDILQGYIDIIRKRLLASYNTIDTEGEAIFEDRVETSRGTITQRIMASKVNEHSLVGPSQIIAVEQGQHSQQGTKIVTVHEIIKTRQGEISQQPLIRGEIGRSSMSKDFVKKLNRLNSESVRTVVLLSDPTNANLQEVRNIVDTFKDALPNIVKGINETVANSNEADSKKLLEELDELCDYIKSLSSTTERSDLSDPENLGMAQDIAKKIADLSTQIVFNMDPKSKRRSKLILKSRNSFIMDEKTEASLRRASFITATDKACEAVDNAKAELNEEYHGCPLSDEEIKNLESKTVDRMGKLNAAIALLLNAHADPKNIDYEMAVNSMKTINELMPDFIKDAKPLLSIGDESSNKKLRRQIIQLLDGARDVCLLTGSDDLNKIHDVSNAYADVSNKLIFTFNRANRRKPDHNAAIELENQILDLAKDVGEKVSLLLMESDNLSSFESNDPRSQDLDDAGVKCADATQGLLACAKLTSTSIHEPHCQSALTAAIENISSSSQNLALAYKPLVEKPGRHSFALQLTDRTFDLAKALDRLKNAYINMDADKLNLHKDDVEMQQAENVDSISKYSEAKNALAGANNELEDMIKAPMNLSNTTTNNLNPYARGLLSQKMAQLNAAIASLTQATSDANHPDHEKAEMAIKTICQLTPSLINDTKELQGSVDENSWQEITENLKSILEATQDLLEKSEDGTFGDINDAASKIANSSGKLTFVFNPRHKAKKTNEIIELSKSAAAQTSDLLNQVNQLVKTVGGDESTELGKAAVEVVKATIQLQKTAEITAASIDDADCQAILLSAINELSDKTRNMERSWQPIIISPEYQNSGELLNSKLNRINASLDKLKAACQNNTGKEMTESQGAEDQDQQRLRFIATLPRIKANTIEAVKELKAANSSPFNNMDSKSVNVPAIKNLTSQRLAKLNAAIANLLQATSDNERPDYEATARAIDSISNLTPEIIKDAKSLRGTVDDDSWKIIMENLKSIVDTTSDLCANAHNPEELKEYANNYADSVGKLTYVFNPRRNAKKEKEILDLSEHAVKQTSLLLSNVYQFANNIDGDDSEKLDKAGVRVADSANALLKTAEVTSPSINDTDCKSALLSSVDRLANTAEDLKTAWKPIIEAPKHHQIRDQLNQDFETVQVALEEIKQACQDTGIDVENSKGSEEQEQRRQQFIATLPTIKSNIVNAVKELNAADNLPSNNKDSKTANIPVIKNLTSQRLAKLNAAIANLLQATSDNEGPDYEAAARAIDTISSLTPEIIQDAKFLRSTVDDDAWKIIMENLKSIVDTTSELCANANDPEELKESATDYANSVGKLTYVFNPRSNRKKENQILDLSKDAVKQTSSLLSNVYELANSVNGVDSEKLDKAGVRVADSANMLLKTAEVTCPTIQDTDCKAALLSSVDQLANTADDLKETWKPIVETLKQPQTENQLDKGLKAVQSAIDKIRLACREQDDPKAHNLKDLSDAKNKIEEVKKLFSEDKLAELRTSKNLDKSNEKPVLEQRLKLSEKLAQLNQAVALLLQAMLDRNDPDYEAAEQSINAISQLTPEIIQESLSLHRNLDDNSRNVLINEAKSLCDASQALCNSIENDDLEELNNAATTYAQSSRKLRFIVSPRSNPKKEKKILDISRSAVDQTSQLLTQVDQLAQSVGGAEGASLDTAGVKVVYATQQLQKTAEITAQSIDDDDCKETLMSSIDNLSDHLRNIENSWTPITQIPVYHQSGKLLNNNLKIVNSTLDSLKEACENTSVSPEERESEEQQIQKAEFEAILSQAKKAMVGAVKELNDANNIKTNEKNAKTTSKNQAPAIKTLTSQRLAKLNAAIASLLQAISGHERPDYDAASSAINTISNLTPEIIKDAKSLRGAVDDNSWQTIVDNLKSIVDTTGDICANANNPEELQESVSKFANSSARLTFIFNPRNDPKREDQILSLSRNAAEQTSLLLSNVYQLAEQVGPEDGEQLDKSGVRVVESTKIMLKTAEIASPSIRDDDCQAALLSSIDKLSSLTEDLKSVWKPLVQLPKYHQIGDQLDQNYKIVETTLDNLRTACQGTGFEESKMHELSDLSEAKNKINEAEKLFSVDNIAAIRSPEAENKNKTGSQKSVLAQRVQVSEKLAQLNEAVALLLLTMSDREDPDYKTMKKTITDISNLTPEIIQETLNLHRNFDDNSLDILFDEAKKLCDANRAICTSVENNSLEGLYDATAVYEQSSGQLHSVISPRSYPNKEKKILDVSRSTCERTSLMLSRVSRLAEIVGGDEGESLDVSGAKVADFAQALLRIAQITSPSISDRSCRSVFTSSIEKLLEPAQGLEEIWKPLIQHSNNRQIGDQLTRDLDLLKTDLNKLRKICQDDTDFNEAIDMSQQQMIHTEPKQETVPKSKNYLENVDKILDDIYKNTKGDVSQKALQEIIIEDTPLRQLAVKIMESAKVKAESNKYTTEERKKFADLANKLANAISKLDVSNAKCRDTPFDAKDKNKSFLELQNAVLNLQVMCVQSRQKEGEQSNIVDLAEFINDVTSAVDDVQKETKEIKQENGKEAVTEIKNICQKMQDNASKLLYHEDSQDEGDMSDYILQIDNFAKDCDNRVKDINEILRKIGDDKAKQNTIEKLDSLEEKCDLLSFAAKTNISMAESATLEESLRNLEDVEKKIELILKPTQGIANQQEHQNMKDIDKKQLTQAVQSSLAKTVLTGNENELPKALTRYATRMKILNNASDSNLKLKNHLDNLMAILKMQIAAKNRRVMTWQDHNDEEVSTITEKILEELNSYAHDINDSKKPAAKGVSNAKDDKLHILKDSDLKRLLNENISPLKGEEKELKTKLNQQIQKLNSTTGTIVLSLNKPESLARSLHTTSEAAIQLSAIAKGLKNQDPVQNKKIEEAVQETRIATYHLAKTSESVCQSPDIPASRRKLLEACRLLNDALNNLARATNTGDKMQRDCGELNRSLHLQQSFLQSDSPSNALSYTECLDALQNQQEVINKLKSEQPMSRSECSASLRYISSAICNSAEYASQGAYLLSLSKADQNTAKVGVADVPLMKKLTESINETCVDIICNGHIETREKTALNNQVKQLQETINDASTKVTAEEKKELLECSKQVDAVLKELDDEFNSHSYEDEKLTPRTMKLMDAINKINVTINKIRLPKSDKDPKTTATTKEVLDNTRNLISKTTMMTKKASSCEEEVMTWVMFGNIDVIKAFETLLTSVRDKGVEAGLVQSIKTKEEPDAPVKSYVQTQLDAAMYWLRRPASKETEKSAGIIGAENIVKMAEQMCDDLHGAEKDEMKQVITETNQLLKSCTIKYNSDKASLFMERIRELRKMLERGVVTRVVEDFLDEEPLANLENIVHKENDEKKRKLLLEKKIAELLAQLGRVKKTAKFVADTGIAPRQELMKTTDQVELLAPSLVKAAQQRIQTPDDEAAIKHYQKLLAEYSESLARVRELCDKAVDPIEFSQAAGETMQRLKEESSNDPQKSTVTPKTIMKLCNRVIDVGMHSDLVKQDPELKKTLDDIKQAVKERQSETKRTNWNDVTAELLRRTGEVESVLGGENIFLKQPEPDQPIYAAALDLHSAVRGWSARNNEIVAVAKRTAVLMAKLSEYMLTDKQRELIVTSNSIVTASREVARLAKKLALECSDMRIRTNLLQVCDRIPTISGQLKMLTTVKSSSLGHQGSAEDQEAMNMLVGNAQNLMKSIQEVVKAAESASVKIMSQRGHRMKWIQRTYY